MEISIKAVTLSAFGIFVFDQLIYDTLLLDDYKTWYIKEGDMVLSKLDLNAIGGVGVDKFLHEEEIITVHAINIFGACNLYVMRVPMNES